MFASTPTDLIQCIHGRRKRRAITSKRSSEERHCKGRDADEMPCLVAYSRVAVVAFVCEAAYTVVVAVALDIDAHIGV
jgi:hypothetical protein